MQNQSELHQSLLSGNVEISTCKSIGNLFALRFFFPSFNFPSAEDK